MLWTIAAEELAATARAFFRVASVVMQLPEERATVVAFVIRMLGDEDRMIHALIEDAPFVARVHFRISGEAHERIFAPICLEHVALARRADSH